MRSMDQMAVDWPEWPSGVPVEFDHQLSCQGHPSNHHEIDVSDANAAGIRKLVEVRGGFQSLLVHGRCNRPSSARPRYLRDWGCTVHTQQGVVGAGNVYTAAVLGGVDVVAVVAVAGEVVVDGDVGPVIGGVERAATRRSGAPVGLSDRTQDQVADSVLSPVLGLVVMLSRPGPGGFEWELVEKAEDPEKMLKQVILDMENQIGRAHV